MSAPPPPQEPSDTPFDSARPLGDHLEELRRRLFWTLVGAAACSVGAWFLVDRVIAHVAGIVGPMVFVRPLEAFTVKMKLSVLLGVFASFPIFLYHAWRFVGVALTISERRIVLGALPFAYLLFAAGAAFGWFLLVPVGLKFLVSFSSADLRPFFSVEACLSFAVWLTLSLGIVFQIPVVVAGLARWGFLRAATLRGFRKQAVLAVLIVAAVMTPGPDVVSQLLMALPTYLLFEFSILLAAFLEPKDA